MKYVRVIANELPLLFFFLRQTQYIESNVIGRDALGPEYTTTAILGRTALRALERLIKNVKKNANAKPFSLSIHFDNRKFENPPSVCDYGLPMILRYPVLTP